VKHTRRVIEGDVILLVEGVETPGTGTGGRGTPASWTLAAASAEEQETLRRAVDRSVGPRMCRISAANRSTGKLEVKALKGRGSP
jgi:hypothetical protein